MALTLYVARWPDRPDSHPSCRAHHSPKLALSDHRARRLPVTPRKGHNFHSPECLPLVRPPTKGQRLPPCKKQICQLPSSGSTGSTSRSPPASSRRWASTEGLPDTSRERKRSPYLPRKCLSPTSAADYCNEHPIEPPSFRAPSLRCLPSATLLVSHPTLLRGSDPRLSTDALSSRCWHPQPRIAVWLAHTYQQRLCSRPPGGVTHRSV